jgi:hypothetical protein
MSHVIVQRKRSVKLQQHDCDLAGLKSVDGVPAGQEPLM